MPPLVTIIVPVFNVAPWLSQCLASCIDQTYQNIEVIAVNDGSTDESRDVVESFISADNRIKLIEKKNEGVNSARKIGVENATGDYIFFLDGDDRLPSDAIENIVKVTLETNADITCGSYMRILEESEEVVSKEIYSDDVITGTQYLKKVLQGGLNPVCMKLYKSSIVKTKTEYNNLKAGEDLLLTIQWALRANVVAFCPNVIYNYIVCRPGSTMSSDPRVYIKSTFEASYLVFCILNEKPFNKLFERELTNFVCINCYVYLSNLKNEFFNNKTKLKAMSSFIFERRHFLSSRQLRVFSYIFLYNLTLAHWFVKFIQKVKPSINPHFR